MIEAISISCAMRKMGRTGTIFPEEAYKSPIFLQKVKQRDGEHAASPYYIR